MTAATLFSGIGAPEVAMPHWRWLWHAEIEKFPSAVMAARHPSSVNLGDVTADDFVDRALTIGRPDVLVFGSPCQSFSVAGRRLGLDDPRGNLALVALRIVKALEPAWFVFENVPGLLSSDDGRDFGLFLRAVDELGRALVWTSLDAQYFGVAQRRVRVFAVGCPRAEWRRAAAVLLEPESLCGHPPARGEAREDVTGTLAARTHGGGGLGTDFDLDGGLISHSLRADGFDASEDGTGRGTPLIPVTHALDSYSAGRATEDGTGRGVPLVPIAFTMKDYGADAGDLAPTLRSGGHDRSHDSAVAYGFANTAGETRQGFAIEQAPPITTRHGDPGNVFSIAVQEAQTGVREYDTAGALRANGPGHDPVGTRIRTASGVRRLMPIECERLQGFHDDYTNILYRGQPAKDGPRYKAIGNSMAIPVIRWILSRLEWLVERAA